MRSIFEDTREDATVQASRPLVILGLLGLFLFGGGLFWAYHARPTGSLIGPAGVGFVLGLFGVVCVASAVYFLLDRISAERE